MTVLYVLDVADFRPLAEVAGKDPAVSVLRRGPYFEISSDGPIEIERNATGCRNAIWYSAVAAIRDARLSAWTTDLLLVEPNGRHADDLRRVEE
jgi:hypothetical protein